MAARVGPADGGSGEERVVEHERLVVRVPRALFEEQPTNGEGADPGCFVQGWARERRRLPHGGDSTPP